MKAEYFHNNLVVCECAGTKENEMRNDEIRISHKNEILFHKQQKAIADGLEVQGEIQAQKEIEEYMCGMNRQGIPCNLFKLCMSAIRCEHSEDVDEYEVVIKKLGKN